MTIKFNGVRVIPCAASGGGNTSTYLNPAGDSQVSLLLHMGGTNNSTTFLDNSYSPKSIVTNGTAKISTTSSKFGGSSGRFDGSGFLNIPYSSDFDLSSGDYTIEGWANPGSVSSAMTIICKHNYAIASDWVFTIENSTSVSYYTNLNYHVRTVPAISTGTWHHFAVVRNSGSITIYWNGVQAGEPIVAPTLNSVSTVAIGVNRPNSPYWYFDGYIDEIRVSKGIARYTSNFTPPTTSFPNADGLTLSASPSVGDVVYSNTTAYICTSTSPVTWKTFSANAVDYVP
jgi:hypothetical protein